MPVNVRIPAPLRRLTNDRKVVVVEAKTLAGVIRRLREQYPELGECLCDESGSLRRFVNVFVNDQDIRSQGGLDTVVRDGDEISLISAIAGGSAAARR
jgi:sulfur-carrier protein